MMETIDYDEFEKRFKEAGCRDKFKHTLRQLYEYIDYFWSEAIEIHFNDTGERIGDELDVAEWCQNMFEEEAREYFKNYPDAGLIHDAMDKAGIGNGSLDERIKCLSKHRNSDF